MATPQLLLKRIRSHAEKGLSFSGNTSNEARLKACREFYEKETESVKNLHREGAPGRAVVRSLTAIVDSMIQALSKTAFAEFKARSNEESQLAISVVAIGGYGRSELCPLSDVDLMFLYPSKTSASTLKSAQEFVVQRILYVLWDLGLKVGHSSRTVDDAFAEARKDIQTKTALLESRLIYGSQTLFAGFESSYNLFYRKEDPKAYIRQRLVDQRERRSRNGDSVFVQEPDIKSGVGGLRDYHNTLWMAKVRLNVTNVEGLGEQNYLRKSELSEFKTAYDFLLRVRNELHFRSKRPTDLLSLETQPKVAYRLGYRERNLLARVELFMRDYYRHVANIHRLSKTVENRLSLNSKADTGISPLRSMKSFLNARRKERVKREDGFILRGREISFEDKEVFKEDPVRLLRVFRIAQKHELELDFELSSVIRDSLNLIDDNVRCSDRANSSFLAILQESGKVYKILSLMHEHRVLGKFVPEWDRLTCLVQHEYYHRYTADEHTLHTIREFDYAYTHSDPIYERYRKEISELRFPNLLYLILFLHDIGKGKSIKGHAEIGLEIAEPILERMGIAEEQRVIIRFVIKNHLQMARFWQRHDIDDPDTARVFADQMETSENLRLLFIHTFCDARGTAKGLWNQYKDSLHATLFNGAMASLKADGKIEESYKLHKESVLQAILKVGIEGIPDEEISAHFDKLPDRYFLITEPKEIMLHIEMINRLFRELTLAESVESLAPVINLKEDSKEHLFVINVITWDRPGLFHKLAGALNVAGYSILRVKAASRNDNIAIDTFLVVENHTKMRTEGDATMIFEECVKDALIRGTDLHPVLHSIINRVTKNILHKIENPLAEAFPTHVSAYNDQDLERIILEVQTSDSLGLLYAISKCVFEQGFTIVFARINTEREMALDTFYLEPIGPERTPDEDELNALKEKVLGVIATERQPAENEAITSTQ